VNADIASLTRTWRSSLAATRQTIAEDYRRTQQPHDYLRAHSLAVDHQIEAMWNILGLGQQAALVAVGGYGRGQLFPASDIDLLILLPAPAPSGLEEKVASFIGLMWDIGL